MNAIETKIRMICETLNFDTDVFDKKTRMKLI